jgi:hypothetical protein
MYKEKEYREVLEHRGMETAKINKYVESVNRAIQYFRDNDLELVDGSVKDFQEYVAYLMKEGMNSYDELMAVGRYVYLLDLKEPWIYYAAILGGISVQCTLVFVIASQRSPEVKFVISFSHKLMSLL